MKLTSILETRTVASTLLAKLPDVLWSSPIAGGSIIENCTRVGATARGRVTGEMMPARHGSPSALSDRELHDVYSAPHQHEGDRQRNERLNH